MNMKQDTDGLKVPVQFESRLLEIAEKRAGDRCESLSDYINRLVFWIIVANKCQQDRRRRNRRFPAAPVKIPAAGFCILRDK